VFGSFYSQVGPTTEHGDKMALAAVRKVLHQKDWNPECRRQVLQYMDELFSSFQGMCFADWHSGFAWANLGFPIRNSLGVSCAASAPVRQIWQLEERRISGSS
jgi:hypothetical protein